jgi:ATP-dependent helicase HrpB
MSERALPELPVRQALPELLQALDQQGTAVLSAPTGSGKTTLIPLLLLDRPWLAGQRILMLEPRRLAARGAAGYMAQLLGERVGERVGYRVRLDNRVSARTRIEVITEGILTRRIQQDPLLDGVGLIVFDEIHERSLHSDLALTLALDVRRSVRPDLRLLAMSATLAGEPLSRFLDAAPRIESLGRSHPVEVEYLPRLAAQGGPVEVCLKGIGRALRERAGDILVFLPGGGEIRRLATRLEGLAADQGLLVCPLYGDLGFEAQQQAIRPDPEGRRRLVLASSIAETSLTIEGIDTVVDSGWGRMPRFDPNSGLGRLVTLRVSRASADQRAGRAGRLGPGHCYRLWDHATQQALRPHDDPEILHADLAPLALELARWGEPDPSRLSWLDPPPAGAYAQARSLLRALDAVDPKGRITPDGERMARLPLHPRLAHMLLQAQEQGQARLASDLAALLNERDPIRAGPGGERSCDIEDRLRLLALWRRDGDAALRASGVSAAACGRLDRIGRQWRRNLGTTPETDSAAWSPGALLALAYPDRIAKRRAGAGSGYLLASGRAASLPEQDGLNASEYLVAAALDAGQTQGRIHLAAALAESELRALLGSHISVSERVFWDAERELVAARREERLGALLLNAEPLPRPDPQRVRPVLLDAIRSLGLDCLPWSPQARDLQARIAFSAALEPEEGWPQTENARLLAELDKWLGPFLGDIRRRSDLERLDLAEILRQRMDWRQQRRLEELAPTHLQVPSGSRKRLDYSGEGPPALAVRLQEMFGQAETPRIGAGRVAVVLHLLSPAQRPIQVTQDLRGFWDRTYTEVKKELKGRYPKHHWPDDPWQAVPTARAKRRR